MTQTSTPEQPQTSFAYVAEAMYATSLRAKRDITDADLAADFLRPTQALMAKSRALETANRMRHETRAIEEAVAGVVLAATRSRAVTIAGDEGLYEVPALDLEGASITVSVADLVATATLTLPV